MQIIYGMYVWIIYGWLLHYYCLVNVESAPELS